MSKNFKLNKFVGDEIKIVFPERSKFPITLRYDGGVSDNNGCVFSYSVYHPNSVHENAYKAIKEKIYLNTYKFRENEWGYIRGNKAIIIGSVYDEIVDAITSDRKGFTNWAVSVGIIKEDDKGNSKKVFSINGKSKRCVEFQLDFSWNDVR